ncbi:hypothetical protein V6N13_034093 [Hibiscus sabdariffa]
MLRLSLGRSKMLFIVAELAGTLLPRTVTLSSKAKPAEIDQPLVDDRFQAVVLQAIIKEEPLFFPSILGSNYFVITFSNCCIAKSGRHAFGGG